MNSIWGEGLSSKRYWGGHIQLRRNSLVHEVVLSCGRLRITFVIHQAKA